MPRLSIEEEWFIDPRRGKLIEKLGEIVTDGLAIQIWRMAQTYYRKGALIPPKIFDLIPHSKEWEAQGLSERKKDGIYIKGQDDHFAWLRAKKEAGRRGAEKTNQAKSSKPRQKSADDGKTQHPTPSSSSSSFKDKENTLRKSPSETSHLWKFYKEKLSERNIEAIASAKNGNICKGLVSRHGLEKAKKLIQAYLADKDKFVANQAWQIGLLVSQEQKYLARAEKLAAPPELKTQVTPPPNLTLVKPKDEPYAS